MNAAVFSANSRPVIVQTTDLHYRFCTQTDPGRVRSNNEDSVAFDQDTGLCVLADGMGGYNAGEVASSMATAFIMSEMTRWLAEAGQQANPRDVQRAIEICIENANTAVFQAAQANDQYTGMGTTLVVGVFQKEQLLLGHIGDSRCYRLRQGALAQITKDHSLLQEQLDAGLITPEQAASSTQKNLLTRALGVEALALSEVHAHEVMPGDLYLMCSDGLTDMLSHAEISKILANAGSLEQRAQWLTDAANARGGRDNITVLLVNVEPRADKRGLISRWLGKR